MPRRPLEKVLFELVPHDSGCDWRYGTPPHAVWADSMEASCSCWAQRHEAALIMVDAIMLWQMESP